MTATPWFFCQGPKPTARVRLYCLPYAGGSASIFRGWSARLPDAIEVFPLQLPGRETRFAEPAVDRAPILAEQIADAIEPTLDQPFALLGYSMGAYLAFEVARTLRRRGTRQPLALLVAAAAPVDRPRPDRGIAALDDDAFIAHVSRYGGLSPVLLQDPEMLAIFRAVLRADFTLLDHYTYEPEPPFDFPIMAYAGERDPQTSVESIATWRSHTASDFTLHRLIGEHFFINTHQADFLQAIAADLGPLMGA